ncbi:MAG: cysteine desulfurase NifS [Candidatus Buchananbacteria bacterium RIFCSPHIGHO2_02_FULL_38_8]|uniref:cysteine desulfurase n=1 Tax=Candidatus Buchananbacteria bacterium RIFCSPHIGHO2_02_FULL_38_8 TaxID=1797538 RepID=A0A1G1Y4G4_9BACT|nr:MAG: cysteine desulfurase NifS [Candidatus Buchananbacteria bacterium RIFCSPHIGHO2_02_FULL_38_8]
MDKAYFDHSATTPVDPAVKKAMEPFFGEIFGNASSIHLFGQQAVTAVDNARETIADFLGCKTNEIIFTSGATESDNIVIQGLTKPGEHIITSKIEHPAILESCKEMEKRGVEVTYVNVNQNGLVEIESIKKAIKDNTRLVSIMYVNNEIGTIQPVAEIGQLIKDLNQARKIKIYFHTDAVQAANYCDINVDRLGVDLISLSAHKIYGPKGIGVLYRRSGVPIKSIQFGGHHEYGLRPGTLNVPGIVGLGKAVELLLDDKKRKKENERIKNLRDKLIEEIKKAIPKTQVNGDLEKRTPHNAHFSFYGVEGESMLLLLDQEGIAVSTGSACSSGSLEPSHVLMALEMEPLLAHGSLRVTLGKFNTEKDIDHLIEALPPIVEKLRRMSPIK